VELERLIAGSKWVIKDLDDNNSFATTFKSKVELQRMVLRWPLS
jgi:hypothetical protein